MTLRDFISEYINHNSTVRLLTRVGVDHETVSKADQPWDKVSMAWEITRDTGIYRGLGNREVIGIVSIMTKGFNQDAINIVIESESEHRERQISKII